MSRLSMKAFEEKDKEAQRRKRGLKPVTKKFKWVIELTVDQVWIADGFDPDDAQMSEAIRTAMLGYANEDEVKARIVKRPKDKEIAVTQGYKSALQYRLMNWRGRVRI